MCEHSKHVLTRQAVTRPICTLTQRYGCIQLTAQVNSVISFTVRARDNEHSVTAVHDVHCGNGTHFWRQPTQAVCHKELWPVAQEFWHSFVIRAHRVKTADIELHIPAHDVHGNTFITAMTCDTMFAHCLSTGLPACVQS